MTRFWLIAGAAALALIAPAAADPGKDKGPDKRWEQVKKSREKAFKAREKFAEKRFKAERKWAEKREKHAEKALEKRAKAVEKAAKRERKAWERAYDDDWAKAYAHRTQRLGLVEVGRRLDRDRYGNVPSYYRSRYADSASHYYRYDDGYLYRVNRGDNVVSSLIPLLGGGYRVGQMLPVSYAEPVPDAYSRYYYDTDDHYYRYGDGAIYQVNAQTGIIESIAALLTGNRLGVGSRLPMGYDAYNLPLQYRNRYQDRANAWYRYNDGHIYQVDPATRLIQAVISAIA